MRNRVKKARFKLGHGHNKALMRKLALNFLKHGQIDTTLTRGKALKAHMDRLVHKAQKAEMSDKNVLLKHLADEKAVQQMIQHVAPSFKRTTGFVTLAKLGQRQGDSAEMVRVSWVKDITKKAEEAVKKAKK